MRPLILSLLLACSAPAATVIEIAAKFADVPAGLEIPASPAKLDQIKGVEVLSAPKVTTKPGTAATIEITQETMVPGASAVPIGVALSITPTLGEKIIQFNGKATDRASHGKRSTASLNTVEFATREIYFEGSVASGGSVVLHTAPVVSKTTKDDKTTTKSRELVVYLTFTKKVIDDAPKKPATKPAAATKGSTTKGKPSTKKSR